MKYENLSNFNIKNLQDSYTILYAYLVRELINDFGIEGERAAREGTRRFGIDRGLKRRSQHLVAGYKVNMLSLFSVGGDLPGDPRFKRDLQRINSQERVSHTLVCPMSDVWTSMGERDIGRIYCEEFHFACYNAYAYGYTQVNLARTLTQGDDYCSFNVVLRPEFLPKEERINCFEEYDPNFKKPKVIMKVANAKDGFNSLCIRIYYYILEATIEQIGVEGISSITKALGKYARNSGERMKLAAIENNEKCTMEFVDLNFPFKMANDSESLWEEYNKHQAREILVDGFYNEFLSELGLEYE